MAKNCPACGAVTEDDSRFCYICGARVAEKPAQSRQKAQSPATNMQRSAPRSFDVLQTDGTRRAAAAVAQPALAFGPTGWIKGTAAVLLGQLGAMLAGIFKVFTKFRALLFTAAISALWIWLNHLDLFEGLDGAAGVLAKITYSRGGTDGTVLEIIGGTLGKGIVGAGLCSILYGGIAKMFRGIKNLFTQPGFHIGALILGFGVAALTYQFTAGFADTDSFMVGAAGAMMSLEALSLRKGFLVNLAASFSVQKVKNGNATGRRLLPGRYKGFLTGTTLGFLFWMLLALAGALGDLANEFDGFLFDTFDLVIPEGLVPYLIPFLLILIGLILNAIGKGAKKA